MSMNDRVLMLAAPGFAHVIHALRALSARFSQFVQALAGRRHAAALAALDDRLLADIGLTRADLRDAANQPLWRDPTHVLARRARSARSGGAMLKAWRSIDAGERALASRTATCRS